MSRFNAVYVVSLAAIGGMNIAAAGHALNDGNPWWWAWLLLGGLVVVLAGVDVYYRSQMAVSAARVEEIDRNIAFIAAVDSELKRVWR